MRDGSLFPNYNCVGKLVIAFLFSAALTAFAQSTDSTINSTLLNFDSEGDQIVRLDTQGNAVDAHDGELKYYNHTYYLYGTSYNCGFEWLAGKTFCGFKSYSSTDLTHWKDDGMLFDATSTVWQSRCTLGCFRPHVVHNDTTGQYVLWINLPYDYGNESRYRVLTSSSPTGPFVETNAPPTLSVTSNGDENLFVDDDGTGYVIYTSFASGNAVIIEKLNSSYSDSTGQVATVLNEYNHAWEAPSMFKRNGVYYALYGPECGYCDSTGTEFSTATSPLGPWIFGTTGKETFINPSSCGGQPTDVAVLSDGTSPIYLFMSDLWYHSYHNEGRADYYWAPLAFNADGSIQPFTCNATVPMEIAGSAGSQDPIQYLDQTSGFDGFSGMCDIAGPVERLQTFKPGTTGNLASIGFNTFQSGNASFVYPNGDLQADIVAVDVSGQPLQTLGSYIVPQTSIGHAAEQVILHPNISVQAGSEYGILLKANITTGCYGVLFSDTNPYPQGREFQSKDGSTFTQESNRSLRFETTIGPAYIQPSPPAIRSFAASPNTLAWGQSAVLSWQIDGATSATIDQQIGDVTNLSSKTVSPANTVTYTLTAANSTGSTTKSVTIVVTQPTTTPPGGTNYALASNGATALASSEFSNGQYSANSTINGNVTSQNWGHNGGWNDNTSAVFPDWLEVDFSGPKTLGEIDIYTLPNRVGTSDPITTTTPADLYGITDFQVQYDNGAGWQTVSGGAVTGNTVALRQFTFTPIANVSRIRVLVTNSPAGNGQYSRIVQVAAYGPSATNAAANVAVTDGSNQSAVINTSFATALQATVTDTQGNPVSGITVTFAAPTTGASATFGSSTAFAGTTNTSGQVTAPALLANATAGAYTITATVAGLASASFSLHNTAGLPSSISATAGATQSAAINSAIPTALQATVKDAGGNPVSGVTVTFTAPSAGASAMFGSSSTATAQTNTSGQATAPMLMANSHAGTYVINASVAGVAGTAAYTLTNTAGLPAFITATAGMAQSTMIDTTFAIPLQVTVTDAGGKPVTGVTVTFTAPSTGASAMLGSSSTATALTNGSGQATAPVLTANSHAGTYSVSASVAGLSTTAVYALTNTVGVPASITATAGVAQSTMIDTTFAIPLQVTLTDAGGNPISGAAVTFTVPSSGASAAFAISVQSTLMTNSSGQSTAPILTANNTPGSYTVIASVSGLATTAAFTLTNMAPAPPKIANPLGFFALTPCRMVDTRTTQNKTGMFGPPSLQPYTNRDFPLLSSTCNIPSTAQVYSSNVTVVPTGKLDFLSAWPANQPYPDVSTLNSPNGNVIANAAMLPAGAGGAVTITAAEKVDLIMDINGYFAPPNGSELVFYPLSPCRVVDTRSGQGKTGPYGPPSLVANIVRDFPIANSCGVPATAQAFSLNMTAVPTKGKLDFLSTWPAGQNYPGVSTLNSPDGSVIANAAIVQSGDGLITVAAGNPTDLIIDVNGYFGPPGGAGALHFYPITPCRVVDTRTGQGKDGTEFGPPRLSAYSNRDFHLLSSTCNIPSTAQAYSLNFTALPYQGQALSFLSTWPKGQAYPGVSTLNSPKGTVIANAAIVPAGTAGAITVAAGNPTDLIIDINGYFAP